MANVDRANGLTPVRHLNGAPYNGQVNRYCFLTGDGTATFVGDLVKLSGTGHTDGTPAIAQAAAGDASIGVLVGLEPDPTNLGLKHRTASTFRYAYVADDPHLIFEIQEDSVGGALAVTEIGLCTNVVVGSGNTSTGASGMQLDSSDVSTDTAGQLRILRLVPRDDNAIGSLAKWEVQIAEHSLNGGTAVDV